MNPAVVMLKSPPGSNTRNVSNAFSIPGAFSVLISLADRVKLPSVSVVPSKKVVVVGLKYRDRSSKLYSLYPGNVVLLWDNFSSVLTFSELVLAPCNQRVCTGMELSGIPFPRMSFGRLVTMLRRLGLMLSMRTVFQKETPPTRTTARQ